VLARLPLLDEPGEAVARAEAARGEAVACIPIGA
jgi:hypothetical protein